MFLGEGAAQNGRMAETLNAAAKEKLPLLFLVIDNGRAINTFTPDVAANSDVFAQVRVQCMHRVRSGVKCYRMFLLFFYYYCDLLLLTFYDGRYGETPEYGKNGLLFGRTAGVFWGGEELRLVCLLLCGARLRVSIVFLFVLAWNLGCRWSFESPLRVSVTAARRLRPPR